MDRISDERLDDMIEVSKMWTGNYAIDNTSALNELRERRAAEKAPKPEPYDAWWTNLECPRCHHQAVCLDKFGYRCVIDGCGWTKDE